MVRYGNLEETPYPKGAKGVFFQIGNHIKPTSKPHQTISKKQTFS